ncbi:hypothetical protein DR74_5490 [Enterobacter cloacae]|nr:hypothetical protein DR74_5490 [Enterobacter cloacae]
MVAAAQVHARREAPGAVRARGGGAQHVAAVHDGHGAARLRRAADLRTGVVGERALRQAAGHAAGVIGHGGDFHLARDHVNGDDHVRAFRPGVARRIGDGGGQVVCAVRQRLVRGVAPGAVRVHLRGADDLAVVDDVHRAARLGLTAQGRGVVIGGVAAHDRALVGADVVGDQQVRGRVRGFCIDNDTEAAGWLTGAAHAVGDGGGEVMAAVCQRRIRREAPAAVAGHGGGANQTTVVVDTDGAARHAAAAAQGRGGVVGDIALLQVVRMRGHIVIDGIQRRCLRRYGGHVDDVLTGRAGDVAHAVGLFRRQGVLPVRQRRGRLQGPGAVSLHFRGANHLVAVVDGDGVARLCARPLDQRTVVVGFSAGGNHACGVHVVVDFGDRHFAGVRRGVVGDQYKII